MREGYPPFFPFDSKSLDNLIKGDAYHLGGVFHLLFDESNAISSPIITGPVLTYGSTEGVIMARGDGTVEFSIAYSMSEGTLEDPIVDASWTDWTSLGSLVLSASKALTIEIAHKPYVWVRFKLKPSSTMKGRIVFLNRRFFPGPKARVYKYS